jgi:hypothetical protein
VGKAIQGEYTFLPASIFKQLEEEILRKAQFDDERQEFFKLSAWFSAIRENNSKNIYVKSAAVELLRKLYDAPTKLPF